MTPSTQSPTLTYDPAHFAPLFAIEQKHAWFRARNEMIGELAAEITRVLPEGFRVLEVGCGTGAVLQVLEAVCSRGQVVGMDTFEEGLRFARLRTSCQLVVGDANQPPFGAEFNLVGLFDVLEHLPDDEGVLRHMGELLLPGGALLLTVPADPTLWSYFDEDSHHLRRYELADLRGKLTAAGFEVEYLTHFMRPLVPLMRVYRRAAPLRGKSAGVARDLKVIPVVNELLFHLLRRERARIQARKQIDGGTSILAVARWPAAAPYVSSGYELPRT